MPIVSGGSSCGLIITSGTTTGTIVSVTNQIKKSMFKEGDIVRVVSNSNSHDLPIGSQIVLRIRYESESMGSNAWYYKSGWVVRESDIVLINNNNNNNTMEKFYRAKKDTPNFMEGAILVKREGSYTYNLTDDIWSPETENETLKKYFGTTISFASEIVENSPDWFERVYSVKSIRGMYYVAKDKMKDMLSKVVVDDGKENDDES